MSWVATAIAGSAIVGGILGSKASDKAADAQVDSTKISSETQMAMLERSLEVQAPWRKTGQQALTKLMGKNGLMTKGPGEFTKSPGYEFRKTEGEDAVKNYLSASGLSTGGPGMEGIVKYNQDYATSDYDNFLARYSQSLNPWLSMAGAGQVSAGNASSAITNTGNNVADNQIRAGDARASGYINSANAITGAVGSGINNYLMYKAFN